MNGLRRSILHRQTSASAAPGAAGGAARTGRHRRTVRFGQVRRTSPSDAFARDSGRAGVAGAPVLGERGRGVAVKRAGVGPTVRARPGCPMPAGRHHAPTASPAPRARAARPAPPRRSAPSSRSGSRAVPPARPPRSARRASRRAPHTAGTRGATPNGVSHPPAGAVRVRAPIVVAGSRHAGGGQVGPAVAFLASRAAHRQTRAGVARERVQVRHRRRRESARRHRRGRGPYPARRRPRPVGGGRIERPAGRAGAVCGALGRQHAVQVEADHGGGRHGFSIHRDGAADPARTDAAGRVAPVVPENHRHYWHYWQRGRDDLPRPPRRGCGGPGPAFGAFGSLAGCHPTTRAWSPRVRPPATRPEGGCQGCHAGRP